MFVFFLLFLFVVLIVVKYNLRRLFLEIDSLIIGWLKIGGLLFSFLSLIFIRVV